MKLYFSRNWIKEISAGDTAKSYYRLDGVDFSLYQFDDALSKYYSSVHGSLDDYSIRVDQSVYTNISGGLGIFGCRALTANSWKMNSAYAHSFGYLGWSEKLPGDTVGQLTNNNNMSKSFFDFLNKEK